MSKKIRFKKNKYAQYKSIKRVCESSKGFVDVMKYALNEYGDGTTEDLKKAFSDMKDKRTDLLMNGRVSVYDGSNNRLSDDEINSILKRHSLATEFREGPDGYKYDMLSLSQMTDQAKRVLSAVMPEIAELLSYLQIVFTFHPSVDTMSTNGIRIFINPGFAYKLLRQTEGEYVFMFVLAHEAFHNFFCHLTRWYSRQAEFPDFTRANIAMDLEINWVLENLAINFVVKNATEDDLIMRAIEKVGGLGGIVTDPSQIAEKRSEILKALEDVYKDNTETFSSDGLGARDGGKFFAGCTAKCGGYVDRRVAGMRWEDIYVHPVLDEIMKQRRGQSSTQPQQKPRSHGSGPDPIVDKGNDGSNNRNNSGDANPNSQAPNNGKPLTRQDIEDIKKILSDNKRFDIEDKLTSGLKKDGYLAFATEVVNKDEIWLPETLSNEDVWDIIYLAKDANRPDIAEKLGNREPQKAQQSSGQQQSGDGDNQEQSGQKGKDGQAGEDGSGDGDNNDNNDKKDATGKTQHGSGKSDGSGKEGSNNMSGAAPSSQEERDRKLKDALDSHGETGRGLIEKGDENGFDGSNSNLGDNNDVLTVAEGEEIMEYEGLDDYTPDEEQRRRNVKKFWEDQLRDKGATVANRAGGIGVGDLIGDLHQKIIADTIPVINWQYRIKSLLRSARNDTQRSWSKKTLVPGMYPFPKRRWDRVQGEGARELLMLVDTSGSVSTKDLISYMTEVASIAKGGFIDKIIIAPFDSAVHIDRIQVLDTRRKIDITKEGIVLEGGGGTDYQAAINWIDDQRDYDPEMVIIFSDAGDESPKLPPVKFRRGSAAKRFIWFQYASMNDDGVKNWDSPFGVLIKVYTDGTVDWNDEIRDASRVSKAKDLLNPFDQ